MGNLLMFMPDLGCVYRYNKSEAVLYWCPIFANGVVDLEADEWGPVEEDMVGEEEVMVDGEVKTLSQVYREVEFKLGATV